MANKKEPYSGPFPRKRHSHTCETCKRTRNQGAVACYKTQCSKPQTTESCSCCGPLTPSVTAPQAAAETDGGRTRAGNTPTCEDCGNPSDKCTCEDECPDCGGPSRNGARCRDCQAEWLEDGGEDEDEDECPHCGEYLDGCTCGGDGDGDGGGGQSSLFDSAPADSQGSFGKTFDRQAWEANQARRAELVANPSIIQGALPGFMSILHEMDAAMRAGDLDAIPAISDRADALAEALQNGDRCGCACEDGSQTLLEDAAAAPDGVLPMWGQKGNIVLMVGLTKIRFEVDGIYGIGSCFGFSIHAVDWHKPFPSDTGYRSFVAQSVGGIPRGWSVADFLIATVKAYIARECKKGLPFIGFEYQERHGHEVCNLPVLTDGAAVPALPEPPPEPRVKGPVVHPTGVPIAKPVVSVPMPPRAVAVGSQLSLFGGAL